MRELTVKELNRRCGVRGCKNGAHNGKKVYAVMRTSDAGAGMAILCEDCIAEAYAAILKRREAAEATEITEKAETAETVEKAKKTEKTEGKDE